MRKLLVLISIITLSGCYSNQSIKNSINSRWTERPLDEFVLEHGIPGKKFTLSNGDIAYKWKSEKEKDYNSKRQCRAQIVTDSKNIIKEISITNDTYGKWINSYCKELLE